jgi:predicted negative regulator of RcsB-dependent stress response
MLNSFSKVFRFGKIVIVLFFSVCTVFFPQGFTNERIINIEEYDVEVELIPIRQELRAKAILKLSPNEVAVNEVLLEFNGNLTIDRIFLLEPGKSSVSMEFQTNRIEGTEPFSSKNVPILRRKKNEKQIRKVAKDPASADTNLLDFQQYRNDHLLEITLPRTLVPAETISLVIQFSGILSFEQDSPIFGVTTAHLGEDVSYLLVSSRWFPMSDSHQDRVKSTFRITVPKEYQIAMEGDLTSEDETEEFRTVTIESESSNFPGSLAVARYEKISEQVGQFELRYYVFDHKRNYIDSYTKLFTQLLEFYSEKFSSYPSRTFNVVVIDDNSLLGFSSPGMLFLADRAFGPIPNIKLISKELSSQWWGYLISPSTESDLWLKEGFSTYSALLYEEKILTQLGFAQELQDISIAALLYEDDSSILNAYQLDLYSPEYNSILKNKGAYVLHMLRGVMGDNMFFKLLKQYLYDFTYKKASIRDFRSLAEKISGKDLGYFFSQWIEQTGVPEFEYEYTTFLVKNGYRVDGVIKQDLDLFRMPLEIEIKTDGDTEIKKIEMMGSEYNFSVPAVGRPKSITIDPNNKVLKVSRQTRLATLIARGDEFRRLGEPNNAISQYQRAIEFEKNASLAFYRVGEVFLEQRSTQSAANSFREALNGDLDPKWIEVWCYINLGKIFDMAGQRERALNEYQRALDTNDNSQGAQEIANKYIRQPYKYEGRQLLIK